MTRKIFQSPPLGDLARAAASEKPVVRKTRTRAPATVTEIPMPPDYRVDILARLNNAGGKWHTQAMRSHRSPTLLWFTRGQGRVTVAGVTRGFGPHNLVYLPTRTMYGFEPVGQVYGYAVHLPETMSPELPDEPLHMRFREATQQNEVTALIEALHREIDSDQPGRDKAMALQAGLLAVWLDRQVRQMPDYDLTPDASRRLVAAFTSLVEAEFRRDHSVGHYAAELGVTATHLTRACNIACGRSASALLADRVHFEARRMLRETDLPVKDIAEKLGFHSAGYFSRAFRKETGQTPRAFRQMG